MALDDAHPTVDRWNPEREAQDFYRTYRVKTVKAEGDTYEFYTDELRMAKTLASAVSNAGRLALKEFDKLTGLEQPKVTARRAKELNLLRELDRLVPIMRGAWTPSVDKTVTGYITRIMGAGNKRAGGYAQFTRLPTRPNIIGGMVASAKYYTNEHFNRIILPSIAGDIQRKIDKGEPFDDTFFRALRDKMDTRLKSVPYWRLVANQASSRAYHYGLARGGLGLGYRAYRLDAVLDSRTTEVCRSLNGKEFWLADAVDRLEKLARVKPDDIAKEAPWLMPEDVEEKDSAALAKAGILTPPFHANCRTTMKLIR